MKSFRLRILAQTLPFLLITPGLALAQNAPTRGQATAALNQPAKPGAAQYTRQQIDQMVAPIALYPDQLLSQVLMAATYPQQVVEAAQWLREHGDAKGDALAQTLEPLPWDPSVKALVAFPQVLEMMAEHIEWTQALGVAFATQQAEVMTRVQALRHLAMKSGKLKQVRHLTVREQGPAIVITSAEPDKIYVPVYNPTVVYGQWQDREFPPVFLPPPQGFVAETIEPGFEVSTGYSVVRPLWGWSEPDWRANRITVNSTEYTRITRNVQVGPGNTWRHAGPVMLLAPGAVSRTTSVTTTNVPAGTVLPGRAAAVTVLPQRAAAQPNLIQTQTTTTQSGQPGQTTTTQTNTSQPGQTPSTTTGTSQPGQTPTNTAQPNTSQPGQTPTNTAQPNTSQPGQTPTNTAQPNTSQPGQTPTNTAQPNTSQPGQTPTNTAQPNTSQPGQTPTNTAQPSTSQPAQTPSTTTAQPSTSQPGQTPSTTAAQPSGNKPGEARSTTNRPAQREGSGAEPGKSQASQPGAGQPGKDQPAKDQAGRNERAAGEKSGQSGKPEAATKPSDRHPGANQATGSEAGKGQGSTTLPAASPLKDQAPGSSAVKPTEPAARTAPEHGAANRALPQEQPNREPERSGASNPSAQQPTPRAPEQAGKPSAAPQAPNAAAPSRTPQRPGPEAGQGSSNPPAGGQPQATPPAQRQHEPAGARPPGRGEDNEKNEKKDR